MSISTVVYVLFYFIPVSYVLITDEGKHHIESLCVASVPAMILMVIEIYQIREQGREYFRGWNVVDLLQIISFVCVIGAEIHHRNSHDKI